MSNFVQPQSLHAAHHSPIKSRHSRWLRPETRRGVNGDGLCTKHNAIAIMRENVCGRLNKRAITFAVGLVSLWHCPGSHSPVGMRQQSAPINIRGEGGSHPTKTALSRFANLWSRET